MEKKLNAIEEAAALIGAEPDSLSEEQAMRILRHMVMTNDSIRIRQGLASFNRIREEKDDE
jgi:hypothetical protein